MALVNRNLARVAGLVVDIARWLSIAAFALLALVALYGLISPSRVAETMVDNGRTVEFATWASKGTPYLMLLAAISLAIGIYVLLKLRQVIGTVSAGVPFDRQNVDRVKAIGFAMVGLAVVPMFLPLLIPQAVRSAMRIDLVNLDPGLLLAALVVFVLAEVFREGICLREDADMTV